MKINRLYVDLIYYLTIKPRLTRLKYLLPEAQIFPTGSRYVCNPPVLITDIDFLVYSEDDLRDRFEELKFTETTWAHYSAEPDDSDFTLWRKGPINLITTNNKEFADEFNLATHIVKAHNVRNKAARVAVYDILNEVDMYDDYPNSLSKELIQFCNKLTGPYKDSLRAAYMAKHNIPKVV